MRHGFVAPLHLDNHNGIGGVKIFCDHNESKTQTFFTYVCSQSI